MSKVPKTMFYWRVRKGLRNDLREIFDARDVYEEGGLRVPDIIRAPSRCESHRNVEVDAHRSMCHLRLLDLLQ